MSKKWKGVCKKYTPISDKELDKIIKCNRCGKEIIYKQAFFYVDGNNISITNNSKPHCKQCYKEKYESRF